jgi:hypothetical protein
VEASKLGQGRKAAPRGRTPILQHPFNCEKSSVCSTNAYRWDEDRCRMDFRVIAGSYNYEKLISFLGQLNSQLSGRTVILV